MDGTALVLGGGGPVGGAWLTGVLAGLADGGIDPTAADTVIGTSAGAVFGARLACGEPARELYERQLADLDRVDMGVTAAQTLRFLWAALATRDPERSIRRLGRAALTTRTAPAQDLHATVRTLLRDATAWPAQTLRITAVDARTGSVEAFDADSALDLADAVAASCAVPLVWPPAVALGRRWIDGGSRSTGNLQLAAGHRQVLALSPVPAAVGPHPSAQQQAAQLRAAGAHVTLIAPDAGARRAMGRNLTANARRPAAARAGHRQGAALAASVARTWPARA
ncbi:patatin-like phospholipase family protein [Streptomyces sp. SP17BM10]|uniref:patatin-like phospholipase family protein n=1 Tax=Streptomyces sp. SP17BM10 TaxID=3002530 RepID=UPI002E776264|nr:patatin-like phospholipase family protein [Streptomyces sp. SP17BM10]MEE1782171.1 patatin-like phospholipase family protein [Streptomyces sp. SP17BM10]